MIIMARLLTPEDYCLVGMLTNILRVFPKSLIGQSNIPDGSDS
jgi:hypothetical protein